MQFSTPILNARLDAIEALIGPSAVLEIRSGSKPANCAAADSGALLMSIALPSDWMDDATAGTVAKKGTWSGVGLAAAGSGTAAGHFRLKDSTATTCGVQGTITGTGDGGDMELVNVSIAFNQPVAVTGFNIADPNG